MKEDLLINKKVNIIILTVGIIFWIIAFWQHNSEEGNGPFLVLIMAPWLGMMLNSYLIIHRTKEKFDILSVFSLILFISGTSALKLVAAFYAADFYQEHFRAFRPDISITLNCYSIIIIAIIELLLIMLILWLYSLKRFSPKKYFIFAFFIFTLGDLFWWFISKLVWIIFHMGGIAG